MELGPTPADAMEFAMRLADAAQTIIDDMGISGANAVQGAAIYAGALAKTTAKTGYQAEVARQTANIVHHVAMGAPYEN